MRQTMFNGNFMTKLRSSNAGHAAPIQNFNNHGNHGTGYNDMNMMNVERDAGGSSFGATASGVGNNRIGTTSGVGNH